MSAEDELRAAIENGISGFCGISLPGPRWKACADSVESYVRPLLDKRDERIKELMQACATELNDAIAALCPTLGYPYNEQYGWVIGDHTAVTLVMEAAQQIAALRTDLANHRATINGLNWKLVDAEQQIKRMKDLHDTDCLIMREQQAAIKEARETSNG